MSDEGGSITSVALPQRDERGDTSVRLGFSSGVCYHNGAEPELVPRRLDEWTWFREI
jgi:hypothetical protein